jgi:predicted nuclease of predicted toxin-antitoxin system
MNILFDECMPRPLKRELTGHTVRTVQEMDWRSIKNGQLLALAKQQSDVFITTDANIRHQQNLVKLRASMMSIVILEAASNRLEDLLPLVPSLQDTLDTIQAGELIRFVAT